VGSGLQGIILGLRYASVSVVSQFTAGSSNNRYNTADQINYTIQTSTGMVLATGSTTGTANTGFTVASVPTVAASYPFTVVETMASGSLGTLQNYYTTLTCTNSNGSSTTKLPVNEPVSTYNFPALQYGDAVLCTFTNQQLSQRVSGNVYNDLNHNGSQDATESGTGLTLYVKLQPNCTGNATFSATVDPVTGSYTVVNPTSGINYCVILDTTSSLTDTTRTLPAGWIGLENASQAPQITIPSKGLPTRSVDFGLCWAPCSRTRAILPAPPTTEPSRAAKAVSAISRSPPRRRGRPLRPQRPRATAPSRCGCRRAPRAS
jgi:hypothetical protein